MEKFFDFKITSQNKSLPLWSWNHMITKKNIDEQIDSIIENGYGGFFIHPRSGLKNNYLDNDWIELVDYTIEKAVEAGIEAWIYDENGWPSGKANGKVNANPELQQKWLELIESKDYKNEKILYKYDGNYKLTSEEAQFLVVEQIDPNYVDLLNAETTKTFIQETYSFYDEKLKHKPIGFFTDEPQIAFAKVPYSKDLFKFFTEENAENIIGLFIDKNMNIEYKVNFWTAVQNSFVHNYTKQIYQWCNDNNYLFTGHIICEDSLYLQIMGCAGVMPHYEFMHYPGIDWIYGRYQKTSLPQKQLSSVGEQLGKSRLLTESFAAMGWNVTYKNLNWIAEWQMVDGIDLICPHLLSYSVLGNRKRDFPASLLNELSWIKKIKKLNEKFEKYSYIKQNTSEAVRVGVIHPLKTGFANYCTNDRENSIILSSDFDQICIEMKKTQVNYHLIDEEMLKNHGSVRDSELVVGKAKYDIIVLPNLTYIDNYTRELLKNAKENGVKIVTIGDSIGLDVDQTFLLPRDYHVVDTLSDKLYDFFYSNDCILFDVYDINGEKENVYVNTRKLKNNNYITFIQNQSSSSKKLFFTKNNNMQYALYDLHANEATSLNNDFVVEGESTVICVWGEIPFAVKEVDYANPEKITLPREVTLEEDFSNNLPLRNCTLEVEGEKWNLTTLQAQELLLKRQQEIAYKLTYDFNVTDIPNDIHLNVELEKGQVIKLNGNKIELNETDFGIVEVKIQIEKFIKNGNNILEIAGTFRQSDEVSNCFDQELHESVKNSLTYGTELENPYLSGKFFVKSQANKEIGIHSIELQDNFEITNSETKLDLTHPLYEKLPFCSEYIFLSFDKFLDENQTYFFEREDYRCALVEFIIDDETLDTNNLNNAVLFKSNAAKIYNIKVKMYFGLRNLYGPFGSKKGNIYFTTPETFFENEEAWVIDKIGVVKYN